MLSPPPSRDTPSRRATPIATSGSNSRRRASPSAISSGGRCPALASVIRWPVTSTQRAQHGREVVGGRAVDEVRELGEHRRGAGVLGRVGERGVAQRGHRRRRPQPVAGDVADQQQRAVRRRTATTSYQSPPTSMPEAAGDVARARPAAPRTRAASRAAARAGASGRCRAARCTSRGSPRDAVEHASELLGVGAGRRDDRSGQHGRRLIDSSARRARSAREGPRRTRPPSEPRG